MAKQCPNHDPFEEVKFISLFISPKHAYETECPSPPSLEPKPCPSSHPNIVLDDGRDSTMIVHDASFKKENIYAMDILLSTTCIYEDPNLLLILAHKLFKRVIVDAFVYHKHCKSCSSIVVLTLQLEHYC